MSKKFGYIPLSTGDFLSAAKVMSADSFGRFVLAIANYAVDGTLPNNLPADAKLVFDLYQAKVDDAWAMHKMRSEINAKNGRRGGEAKARNAKAGSEVTQ